MRKKYYASPIDMNERYFAFEYAPQTILHEVLEMQTFSRFDQYLYLCDRIK